MNHLQKLKKISLLKCVSSNFPENHLRSSKILFSPCIGSPHIVKKPTFYSSRSENAEKTLIMEEATTPHSNTVTRISHSGRNEARAALLEYLHCTRSLPFTDADRISRNSPIFLDKLLKEVEDEQEIGRALARFFRYHPINEFEPLFESMGLKPSEFSSLLPQDSMFLCDDDVLLENYHVLCNYGIFHCKLGKMYKEATEIFRYNNGVLRSKLQAYEDLGLSRDSVIRVVASSPSLLVGGVNGEFVKVLEVFRSLGIEYNWIGGCLSDRNSYDWRQMCGFLSFFCEMGYSKEELGGLIRKHPGMVFDDSGKNGFSLIGLLIKLGSTMNEISALFLQFPQAHVGTFVKNLRRCLLFLMEIEMEAEDIGGIVRAHSLMLGLCCLKKSSSLLSGMNIGKKRLCGIILDDPHQLKNWILGSRIDPLPKSGEDLTSLTLKIEFLLNLGFTKNSNEMKKALKVCRGQGGELQERFDCFVKAGLDKKDVSEMIKQSPQVLNQSKNLIKAKIDFLVNGLGYPISSLMIFPPYLNYSIQRVKLRFTMYNWLKDEGSAAPMLALSTILASSDKQFTKQYVNNHPKGPEVWENLKKAFQM